VSPGSDPDPGRPHDMVGVVVVAHSRALAEAAVELALQMVRGAPPPIAIAAGLDDGVLGTDAVSVRGAIDRVASDAGVLVLMDLGSAVLSAELALDLGDAGSGTRVVLSDGPLVEGLVAAVVLAAAGAELDDVAADARAAAEIKAKLLGPAPSGTADQSPVTGEDRPSATIELVLHTQHGLHARPAARFVDTIRRFDAEVDVRNITSGGPSVSGHSVSALSTLGALTGHHIEVRASGRHAREVLAAVAAIVGRNFDEDVRPARPTADPPPGTSSVPGPVAAAPGIGIGPKVSLGTAKLEVTDRTACEPEVERERLVAAVTRTRKEIGATRDQVARALGEHDAAIFDAHLLLLEDDDLVGAALAVIDERGTAADRAWRQAVDALAGRFGALADPYLRARADDVRSVGEQVLAHLLGIELDAGDAAKGVVVTADMTPAQAARLDPAHVDGIVTAFGSPLSHGAILARSLGIPSVAGAGEEILAVPDGTVLVVDGFDGAVVVDPPPEVLADFAERLAADRRHTEALVATATRPAVTVDGVAIEVNANISSVDDAAAAVLNGADGVGLLRSEFLFLDRRDPPGEDEQVAAYLAVADALGGRRLTVRTLDAGGDKPVSYLPRTTEANPFLGRRGIRLSLQQAMLFKQQLRALVRVGREHLVSVLFPMVTTLDELRASRRLLGEAAAEVGGALGDLPVGFEVGVMVEVPALALQARAIAPHVDFFSIGSNDLTQYTMAAERGNAAVAHLADPLHPAVLRLIAGVAEAAGARVRVAVCGEVAGDAPAATLLVGLGVRELSMSPPAIPAVKDAVRSLSTAEAAILAELALDQHSAAGVRALLDSGAAPGGE
jgi:phosphoenolpyruvate-protein phosphotransferase/dihydroxyacetone kinase phosphotransfer subunit